MIFGTAKGKKENFLFVSITGNGPNRNIETFFLRNKNDVQQDENIRSRLTVIENIMWKKSQVRF